MKHVKILKRLMLFILCIATAAQCGFVMPAFAAGETYDLFVHYMTGEAIFNGYLYPGVRSVAHPMILPPLDGEYNTPENLKNQMITNADLGEIEIGTIPNIPVPYRVLGYTFEGWYYDLDFSATDPYSNAKQYTGGAITADMVDTSSSAIQLYAKWGQYHSADITPGSVSFTMQNDNGDFINDPVIWTDKDGKNGTEKFQLENGTENEDGTVVDYYGYVYGDVSKIKMDFEQYDPGRVEIVEYPDPDDPNITDVRYENQAETTVHFNNDEENITTQDITLSDLGKGYQACTGYQYDTDSEQEGELVLLPNQEELVTGVHITTTDYMELHKTQDYISDGDDSEMPEENTIEVTVTMPKHNDPLTGREHQVTRTYKFHIKRLDMELKPEYGNTPYGRIMETMKTNPDEAKTQETYFHENEHMYSGYKYNINAWNIYGEDGKNVPIGSTPGENEFINYDEDETAIVVTEGESFNDPGVLLYENGEPVKEAKNITRTIHYTAINSLRYDNWDSTDNGAEEKTETDEIPSGSKAVVNILKYNEKSTEYVKPGIYTIDYEYMPDGLEVPIRAHRNMIVIPRQDSKMPFHFDINMDNYINALDLLIYDKLPQPNYSIIENVFLYRVFDVDYNGTVDETDKEHVMKENIIKSDIYPSLAVTEAEASSGEAYEVPTAPQEGKAQLYMDFLGTDAGALADMTYTTKPSIEETPLKKGDVFYIGYRFNNVANLTEAETDALLHEIVISTSFDTRYLQLERLNSESLSEFLKTANPKLFKDGKNLFNITMTSIPYYTDKSTAFVKWNNIGDAEKDPTNIAGYNPNTAGTTSSVTTTRIEMFLNHDDDHDAADTYELKDNEYLLKLPVRVVNIPPQGERYTKYGDTSIERKTISAKLGANCLNFAFGNIYGYMWDMDRALNTSVTENLLDKLQYMGDITPVFDKEGEPQIIEMEYKEFGAHSVEQGIFEGDLPAGITYSAGHLYGTPEKAGEYEFYINGVRYKMVVNKKRMEVRANDNTMTYGDDLPDLKYEFNEEDLAEGDKTEDQHFPTPTVSCEVDNKTEVGRYDITISGDKEADNYYFVYVDGTMTVTQRPITVTDITKTMPDYYVPESDNPDLTTQNISLNDIAIYLKGEFTVDNNNIVNDDDIRIRYTVKFDSYADADTTAKERECNVTVTVTGISSSYEKGRNYVLQPSPQTISDKTAMIKKGSIRDFSLISEPAINYTYGDKINLDSGLISVTIKTGTAETDVETESCTFREAMAKGIKLTLVRADGSSVELNTDSYYIPTVSEDNDKAHIEISCQTVAEKKIPCTTLHVEPMQITVRADDKERFYGDDNKNQLYPLNNPHGTAGGLTYSITEGNIVEEKDMQKEVLDDHIKITTADPTYDIEPEDLDKVTGKGSTLVPITLEYNGTNQNYAVTVEEPYDKDTNPEGSKLEIKQRPLYITELTAPTLTAPDYIDSDGTHNERSKLIAGYALAGTEDADEKNLGIKLRETVAHEGLCDGDAVKIGYRVIYTNTYADVFDKSNITIHAIGMDVTYGKSRNYYIATDSDEEINTIKGDKEIRRINNIDVIHEIEQHYTFGEPFDLLRGEKQQTVNTNITRPEDIDEDDSWLRITYNTGEVSDITFKELCENFDDNDEYNENLDFNITINSVPRTLNKTFMDAFNQNENGKHFDVKDNISVSLGIKEQAPSWTGTITVSKKRVDVRVDNKSYLYHERPVDFAYTAKPDSADFRWGQTADVIPAGNYTYTCLEDNNVTETSNDTPSGIYTINLSVTDTDNYTFNCISGTLSIRQRPLIITDIEVPSLDANAAKNNRLTYTKSVEWTKDNNNGITFADDFAPLENETITINYTYRYTENPREGGDVPVALSGITIDRLKGDARNYYLQSVASQTTGTVESAYITKLETTNIQGKTDDGDIDPYKTEQYVYGDTLDLSGMTFSITYNTGAFENITNIKDLAKYGVKAEYYKDGAKQDTAVEDGVFLTRDYDGMAIRLSLADDNENSGHKAEVNVEKAVTGNVIRVGKRTIRVGVNNSSYTYGDDPPSETEYGKEAVDGKYTYYLHEEDFPEKTDKTQAEFLDDLINGGDEGYTPPTVSARTQNGAGGAPDNTTDVDEAIQISADVSGASSDNYEFVSDGENGTLTVKPREIKATEIKSSVIPTLTAEIAYRNGNTPPITIPNNSVTVTYGAEDNGITVENMVEGSEGDKVEFTFDVVYNSVTDTGEAYADVDIAQFAMTDKYDAKNYILSEEVPTTSQGKIVTTRVSAVTITTPPRLTYTYGDLLSIDGTVQIDYTSGEQYTVPMNRLYEYGMELLFVKTGTDGFIASDGNMYTDLTGSLGNPEVNKLLTVDGYNGVKLCVKPGDGVRVEHEENMKQYIRVTNEITVEKKSIRLSADNLEMTYGDSVPEAKWSYNQTDLVNGDTLTSPRFTVDNMDFDKYDSEEHRNYIYITEDGSETGTPVSGSTAVGSYGIKWKSWSGNLNSRANYSITPEDGTLTVNKRPLKISRILNVPNLTPDIISEHGAAVPITISHTAKYPDKDYNGNPLDNFVFEEGCAPLEGDEIEISYDAVYKTMKPGEATAVDILNVRVTDYGKGGNYTVETAPTTADGMVSDTNISEIEILSDPIMRDDDALKPIEYVYGDSLNLDRGLVKLTYDNGMSINVNFNSLVGISNGVISLVYCDDNGNNLADYEEPSAGQTLYVTKHNGRHIKISVPEDSGILLKYMDVPTDKLRTNAIKVNKAPLKATVVADEASRIYGDENPTFRFEYSGFRNGDNAQSENFTAELVEPTIDCGASVSSPVGEYTVTAYGGESANYYCAEFEDTTISVTPRPLDVEAITGGIPALTSQIIRENQGPVYTVTGYALNTAGQLTLNNLVPNDVIRVSYDATYASADHDARDVTVAISNMSIMDYGAGKNYELRNTPAIASGGRVYTQKIAGVDIMSQPKTEYTYGEYIDLTQPGVKIVYDDGEVLNDIPYDMVEQYDIDLNITYFDKNGSEVTERALDLVKRQEQFEDGTVTEGQQKLDLTCFNGAYFTLIPRKDDTIDSPSLPTAGSIRSKTLTVNPKVVNVNISSETSVYGEDPTVLYEFGYGDDFVYRETADDVITAAPTFTCTDLSGADVGVTTEVGEYAIRMTGAEADNYSFRYNNGTLTITPRSLTVSNITNGIPALTADIIKESMGSIHYIPASATSSQMECDRINNDDIKINYNAVYSSEEKNDSYNVGIADMELEDGYGRNKNYTLNKDASVKVVEGGGRINDKQITEIKITEQPRLTYTYGEPFDADSGKVHIVYDTGYEDDVTFAELADYRIMPEYYDAASAAAAGTVHGGDRITVSAHNGKVIRLTASSTYEVEAQYTEPLVISKRVLEYGSCIVNPIEYDGATTLTTGTVVFSNTQYEDNVTASAVFNFDDCRAGTNKTVYITDIRLDGAWAENYSLSSNSVTSVGTINKAKTTLTLPSDNVYLSPEDNSITVTAPEMTGVQRDGGAKYQYSIDGGVTWSDNNVFTGLELGKAYSVSLRLAETDNYAATDPTEGISVTTYKVRFTLSSNETPAEGEERRILKRFYTNVENAESEEALRALIGAVTETDENGEESEVTYYTLYDAIAGGTLQFPFSFIPDGETTADVNVYTSLTAARRGGSGGGGGGSSAGGFVGVIISFTDKDGKESENSSVTVELDEGTLKLSADVSSIARNAVVTWSSDNPDVASVNSLGTVKLLSVGTATVTAETKGYRNAEKDTITITVVDTTPDTAPDTTPPPTVSPDPEGSYKHVNIPYLHGFDNMIKPDDSMTRAEAATIMLQLAGGSDGAVYENIFADVRDDAWYKDVIAEAAAKGFISGYDDGLFRPEETVTREQFAAMTVKLAGLEPIYGSRFADVDADRWSAGSINAAVENGIITGYEDGTFLPENPIRRSEAVRMANAATGRIPDKAAIDAVECPYIDLPASHWAYYEFMAAAAEYEIP